MTARGKNDPRGATDRLEKQLQKKTERRRWAKGQEKQSVWFGFGMFGLIGWAVAIPTVVGIALGTWLDRHWPADRVSWTISLLFVGIILGCANAWRWVNRERPLDTRSDAANDTPDNGR